MCGMGIDYILKNSLLRRSLDNVTVVMIAFNNFKYALFGHAPNQYPQNVAKGENIESQREQTEKDNKVIDTKQALQSQNSSGQLKQNSHSKLQQYQQNPK